MRDPVRFATWLYQDHPEAELRRWATSLRFFRFCRAYGGHAGDGDALRVTLACGSEADLQEIGAQLGLTLRTLAPDEPQPEPGKSYSSEEFLRFRSPIRGLPGWEQPGHCVIDSARAFVWVAAGVLKVDLAGASGDIFTVDDADVRNALRVENLLVPLSSRVLDPPQDDAHCICPKHYPHFWAERASTRGDIPSNRRD